LIDLFIEEKLSKSSNLIVLRRYRSKRRQRKPSFDRWLMSQLDRKDATGNAARALMAGRMAFIEWAMLGAGRSRGKLIQWPTARARKKTAA
jgi:hypothetical protein